jgi:outer membrane cobalamin receptor
MFLSAQERVITGYVQDVNTHHEISSVNIFIKGTQVGVTSDFTGHYRLRVPRGAIDPVIVFRHIGYEEIEVTLDQLLENGDVRLQPRVIPLRGVTMEEERIEELEIAKDLPQTVSTMESDRFEVRGFVDAGDLLRTDHSIQVEEELSGKKTISIRGGNPDDIVVVYNGIRMNRSYDNIFDFSLVDLEDVERFEIIKGSNTALYGPEALSGVVNIVPKRQYDYNARFHQRVGTYRSGNWGLHLYQHLGPLHGSYSFKRGGMQRQFADLPEEEGILKNTSLHHTANLMWSLKERSDGSPSSSLNAMYNYTSLEYDNPRDVESMLNINELLSLQFDGDIGAVKDLDISVALGRLDEEQYLASGTGALYWNIGDESIQVNTEKGFRFGKWEILGSYQYRYNRLDFTDERRNLQEEQLGLESSVFERSHHGLVGIVKLHGGVESPFLQSVDLDGSIRRDWVQDDQSDAVVRGDDDGAGYFGRNRWGETMFKFALSLSGYRRDWTFTGYISFGFNTKFPTLFQQISLPALSMDQRGGVTTGLRPEKNRSVEMSVVLARDLRDRGALYGWEISGNYFKNQYDDKFRSLTLPGIPVMFYDNVPDARIDGFETKWSVFFFRKKVTFELGVSKYFISEKAAFPYKSDYKHTFNFIVDHAGYSFQTHIFKEGEQVGWLRVFGGEGFAEVSLPDYVNLDIHVSKTFQLGRLKLFANASGRNLLDDEEIILQGLALRDRRYYLTVGAQY